MVEHHFSPLNLDTSKLIDFFSLIKSYRSSTIGMHTSPSHVKSKKNTHSHMGNPLRHPCVRGWVRFCSYPLATHLAKAYAIAQHHLRSERKRMEGFSSHDNTVPRSQAGPYVSGDFAAFTPAKKINFRSLSRSVEDSAAPYNFPYRA